MHFNKDVKLKSYIICLAIVFCYCLSTVTSGQVSKSIIQQNSRQVFKQGLKLFYSHYYDIAISKFIEVLKKDKNLIIAKKFLGFSLYYSGRVQEAINIWDDLLEQDNFEDPYLVSLIRHLKYSLTNKKPDIFDLKYQYVRTIKPTTNFQYEHLLYLEYLPNGLIALLANQKNEQGNIILLNSNGEYIKNYRKWYNKFIHPTSIHVSSNNNLWVTDMELEYVHRIPLKDVKQKTLFSWLHKGFGSKGIQAKQFLGASSACSMGEYLYVVDYGNNRILKIKEDDHDNFYYFPSKNNDYQLKGPYGIECVDGKSLYVSEPSEGRLVHLDNSGNFLSYVGESLFTQPRNIQKSHFEDVLLVSDFEKGLFIWNTKNNKHRLINQYQDENKSIRFKNVISATLGPLNNLLIGDYGANHLVELQPAYSIYNTLNILVKKIDLSSYPVVAVLLDVKNSLFESMSNLQAKDFVVRENNVIISKIDIDYLNFYQEHSSTIILLENTPKIKELDVSIRKNMNFFFNNMQSLDKVQIAYYNHTQQKVTGGFISSAKELKSSLYEVLNKVKKEDVYSGLSTSLVQSTVDLLSRKGKRSIIWITTQQFDLKDISTQRVIQFAKAHHVNIHVIDYRSKYTTDQKTEWLKQFVKDSGGIYYLGYSNEVQEIYSKVQKNLNPEILLSYDTKLDKKIYDDIYNVVSIHLNTPNKEGATKIGYFLDE